MGLVEGVKATPAGAESASGDSLQSIASASMFAADAAARGPAEAVPAAAAWLRVCHVPRAALTSLSGDAREPTAHHLGTSGSD